MNNNTIFIVIAFAGDALICIFPVERVDADEVDLFSTNVPEMVIIKKTTNLLFTSSSMC